MARIVKWRTPYGTETVEENAEVAEETKTEEKPVEVDAEVAEEMKMEEKLVEDVVNHPNHYAPNGVDSFMHMKDQMGKSAFDGFLQGNAIKYVQRYAFKGKPTEDLCKAAFYLFHLAFEAADEAARPDLYDRLAKTLRHAADHFNLGGCS